MSDSISKDLESRARQLLQQKQDEANIMNHHPDAGRDENSDAPQVQEEVLSRVTADGHDTPEPAVEPDNVVPLIVPAALQGSPEKSIEDEYESVPKPMSPEELEKKLAMQSSDEAPTQVVWPGTTSATGETDGTLDSDDSDEEIILGDENAHESAPAEEIYDEETLILGSDAVQTASELPEDVRANFFAAMVPEVKDYTKELVTKHGYTPEEAAEAAKNRASRKAKDEVQSYKEEHPDGVIINIDKSQDALVKFSEEEKAKLQRANALKLVLVENRDLEHIKVKTPDRRLKMSNIRDICGTLSRYSVPLIGYGDYATFHGAQSGFLANCISVPDDTMLDIIEKKATVLYTCFGGGVLLSKMSKEKPDEPITYEEFCNEFIYDDIDLALYAVVTASAMETTETTYSCPKCRRQYQITYNHKKLLDLSEISEKAKARIGAIDAARSSVKMMEKIHADATSTTRLRSPLTKNIYDIRLPSITQARNIVEVAMSEVNTNTAQNMLVGMYTSSIWLHDMVEDDYYPPMETPEDIWETVKSIHEVDLELLAKYIMDMTYTPRFRINTKCPYCEREHVDSLSTDSMVFLHARATLTEIKF